MGQVTYNGLKFTPFITKDEIQARVADIAARISEEYRDKRPLLICVLTGAFPFAADLFRELSIDAEITFIRLKSYEGTATTGKVKEVMGLTENIKDRDIIIIEDIIDTGKTMVKLVDDLKSRGTASIKVATLLFKPQSLQYHIEPDYVGFEIPSRFIIGYGLDLDGYARNLKDIYSVCD